MIYIYMCMYIYIYLYESYTKKTFYMHLYTIYINII